MTQQFHSYLSKGNENIYLYKDLYVNDYSSIIYSRPKLEAIQMFINWWIDKQNVV